MSYTGHTTTYPLLGYGEGDFEAEADGAFFRLNAYLQDRAKRPAPETTGSRLRHYLMASEWKAKDFTRYTFLERKFFDRIKRCPQAPYAFKTCLAVAVGLGLNYRETQSVLALSGMGFNNGNPDHLVYRFILFYYPGCSMEFFNAVCERAGVTPLGSVTYQTKRS